MSSSSCSKSEMMVRGVPEFLTSENQRRSEEFWSFRPLKIRVREDLPYDDELLMH